MLSSLTVWHAPRVADSSRAPPVGAPAAWRVSTCQRELHVDTEDTPSHPPGAGYELHRGEAAYGLLLRIATGLESAIAGETNVLGQLRRAWTEHEADRRPAPALVAVARALFEDAALIRSRHLQGIGGSSYGTLARMLLGPPRGARVLLAGAGALAQSILPAFASFELALYARRADAFAPCGPARRFGPGEEATAIGWAQFACFCLPAQTEADAEWVGALHGQPRPALHLGLRRGEASRWAALPELRTLDDVFERQHSQAALRRVRLGRAAQACQELARRRAAATDAESIPPGLAAPVRHGIRRA